MKIEELIQLQEVKLGDKLVECSKSPEGIKRMVDVIVDHLAESMKQAFENGLVRGMESKQNRLFKK